MGNDEGETKLVHRDATEAGKGVLMLVHAYAMQGNGKKMQQNSGIERIDTRA